MCPACLALSGLYIAGEVSAGAATTFLPTKFCASDPKEPHRPVPLNLSENKNKQRKEML
jgi:hypothetical protein